MTRVRKATEKNKKNKKNRNGLSNAGVNEACNRNHSAVEFRNCDIKRIMSAKSPD